MSQPLKSKVCMRMIYSSCFLPVGAAWKVLRRQSLSHLMWEFLCCSANQTHACSCLPDMRKQGGTHVLRGGTQRFHTHRACLAFQRCRGYKPNWPPHTSTLVFLRLVISCEKCSGIVRRLWNITCMRKTVFSPPLILWEMSGKHRSDLWPRWPLCLSSLGLYRGPWITYF